MSNVLVGQGASLPGQSGIPGCLPSSAAVPGALAGLELLGRAGMVAVRVADLGSPAREGLGKDGRTALTAAGAGPVRTGDLVVFCKPVAVAAAVVRRDGRVQAAGHPADHVRLGVAEERLDALCGEPGVIDKIAADVTLKGRVKGTARRAMTVALTIRLVLLMTLMPGSCYAEAIAAYPQVRELRCSIASTRATVGVVTGPSGAGGGRDKGEAEQRLLDGALEKYPRIFTPGRLWVMDRNFPGVPRIKAMLATGTHVLIRVKDGITLTRTGDFLPDGSYPALICGGGEKLAVRVIEYQVSVAGHDTPELFCLITDLDDWQAYPAGVLAEAYHWRWIGSETALKEAKSAIRDAGPSTGPMLRSGTPPLIAQEHAAWVISAELARAIARDAAAIAAPARKGRRAGLPVHPREISFTAARRTIISSANSGAATASLPPGLIAANRTRILDALARCRITVDRHRHRDRKTKARPGFPNGGPGMPTLTAPAQISVCGTTAA